MPSDGLDGMDRTMGGSLLNGQLCVRQQRPIREQRNLRGPPTAVYLPVIRNDMYDGIPSLTIRMRRSVWATAQHRCLFPSTVLLERSLGA